MNQKQISNVSSLDVINEGGILCSIISLLPLRDAIRTSILSRKWRYIWTNLPSLKFYAADMFDLEAIHRTVRDRDSHNRCLKEAAEKFTIFVDSVLQHHQGLRVDTFSIKFIFLKDYSHHLNAWINFVVASKTRELKLYLQTAMFIPTLYDFPCQLFVKEKSCYLEHLTLNYCNLKPPSGFDGFNKLRILDLFQVDVTREGIDSLLSNCFTLEGLIVFGSHKLATLSISHPLSRLKYLSVTRCNTLSEIEINAKNLTTLMYEGNLVDFIFRESSQLTLANIKITSFTRLYNIYIVLDKLVHDLPHLKCLFFQMLSISKVVIFPERSSGFIHLRHLIWTVWSGSEQVAIPCKENLYYLVTILRVAPLLEKLELLCQTFDSAQSKLLPANNMKKVQGKQPHAHLKTVEISGFYGGMWQIEFAAYILNNVTKLESITLDHRFKRYYDFCDKQEISQVMNEIPEEAIKLLRQLVPANAKLVIL